jgi:hypothetical protein
MERVRRKLAGADDGNRQMVDILAAVLTDRLRTFSLLGNGSMMSLCGFNL